MRKRAIKKVIVGVLVVVVVVIAGLQVFLAYGLTGSLRKWVLPLVKERLNLDVSVDRMSVNLLAGAITIHGIQVANPPGFEEADLISVRRCGLDVGLLALLGGGIAEIQSASVKEAQLIVVRNKEGKINIQEVSEMLQRALPDAAPPSDSPEPDLDEDQPSADEQGKIPDFKIDSMDLQFFLHYIDHELFKDPFKLSIELRSELKNITNYGDEEELSGAINMHGSIIAEGGGGRFDLDGRISPIVDPTRVSFIVSGIIEGVGLDVFKVLAAKQGLTKGSVSGRLNLRCDKGVFDPEKSVIRLTFNDIRFTKEMQAKMQGIEGLESFTIVVPVEGTLINPQIDIESAIMQSLFSEEVLSAVLKNVVEKQGGVSGLLKGVGVDVGSGKDIIKKSKGGRSFDIKGILRDVREGTK